MSETIQYEIPDELMPYLSFVMSRAHIGLSELVNPKLHALGIDQKQLAILALVFLRGAQSQIEISKKIRVDRTTLVKLIDSLEHNNLLERQPNPEDRRVHGLAITKKGKNVLAKAEKIVEASEAQFLSNLSAREQQTFISLLRKLITA